MFIEIHPKIFEKYPQTEIGYLIAHVSVRKSDPFVENLKEGLKEHMLRLGMTPTNFVTHPNILLWRKIYEEDFVVKAKTYRSSIEALLKRVVMGKEIWKICNIVDLYNCCSILSLLPMGGYDLDKISGNIQIRYAWEDETFSSLGTKEHVEAKSNHVVYADDQRIICWLWNHKDSKETCIDEHSKSVIFFIDGFDHDKVHAALQQLEDYLSRIQCTPVERGILNQFSPIKKI